MKRMLFLIIFAIINLALILGLMMANISGWITEELIFRYPLSFVLGAASALQWNQLKECLK